MNAQTLINTARLIGRVLGSPEAAALRDAAVTVLGGLISHVKEHVVIDANGGTVTENVLKTNVGHDGAQQNLTDAEVDAHFKAAYDELDALEAEAKASLARRAGENDGA